MVFPRFSLRSMTNRRIIDTHERLVTNICVGTNNLRRTYNGSAPLRKAYEKHSTYLTKTERLGLFSFDVSLQ